MNSINILLIRFAQLVDGSGVDIPKTNFSSGKITVALNIAFGIAGAIALLIITISGFKYTMSMGEPTATKKAKDTILFAFIGLFVIMIATAIVNFVLGKV